MTAHALSGSEAATICRDLERQHIPVLADVDEADVVHLWPQRAVSTLEEVTTLAAFIGRTDSPVRWHAWHPAVAS